jgi:uncharacterized membrane protein YdjX (TVP38/TMEM64 family)
MLPAGVGAHEPLVGRLRRLRESHRRPASRFMKNRTRIFLLFGLAATVVAGLFFLPLGVWAQGVVEWVRSLGPRGAMIYSLIYVVGAVFFVPETLLTAASGFLYGPIYGTLLVAPASVLAASISFLLTRSVARDWVAKHVARSPRFTAIDHGVGKHGFKIVLLIRLQPVFLPFAVLNYGLGLTRVRLRDYVLASAIGMLPINILYVYLGSALHDLTHLVRGNLQGSAAGEQAMFWIGLAATALLVLAMGRIAHQALRRQLDTPDVANNKQASPE